MTATPEAFRTGRLALLLFSLLAAAWGQVSMGSPVGAIVRVRVAFADGAACEPSTLVAPIHNDGFTVAEDSLNNQCAAEFLDVPAGNDRVEVRGERCRGCQRGQ